MKSFPPVTFLEPDLVLRRRRHSPRYLPDLVGGWPLLRQLCAEARISEVIDRTIDAFLRAAGGRQLTIETIDDNDRS